MIVTCTSFQKPVPRWPLTLRVFTSQPYQLTQPHYPSHCITPLGLTPHKNKHYNLLHTHFTRATHTCGSQHSALSTTLSGELRPGNGCSSGITQFRGCYLAAADEKVLCSRGRNNEASKYSFSEIIEAAFPGVSVCVNSVWYFYLSLPLEAKFNSQKNKEISPFIYTKIRNLSRKFKNISKGNRVLVFLYHINKKKGFFNISKKMKWCWSILAENNSNFRSWR